MSTNDPLLHLSLGKENPISKDAETWIDPDMIASMAKELFGPLPAGGGVEQLILSGDPTGSAGRSGTSETVHSTSEIFQSSYGSIPNGTEMGRIQDFPISGTGIPSYPGSLNPKNAARQIPVFSTSFSFLEDVRSFVPDSGELVPEDPFRSFSSVTSKIELSSGGPDIASLKRDFPILSEKINGRDLVWLDNAATTHKPRAVIDRISQFYERENSNIHRGAHTLAARATDAYENAREKTAGFLNAPSSQQIVFVRGATEAINLVAQSWGRKNIRKDDEIVITWLEHHANIVPWQMLCAEKGARLKVVPVDETGQIILSEYERLLSPKTKLVALTQVSNALGTVTPVVPMVEQAHRFGAKVLVDGAQAVSHMPIDVQLLDCDFYVFSGHKVFAPTGIGVLYGKQEVLDSMPPWQGGGNMIEDVTFEKTVYQPSPFRFEAGTGNIADAVGLGAAIDYLNEIGMSRIAEYEHSLLEYGTEQLRRVPGLRLIGTAQEKAGVLSFVLDGFKTEDVGRFLNGEGIAVRSGHHCAQPILRRFGLESTVRPSLALYNTCEDIDALIDALFDLRGGRTSGPL
ncbi:family 2A encapsulin nanocompartment cargo protein cysteine desulfurase [Leptospira ellisii]|uniref:Cysteine desulfurase n=2 Tax=Leptospira ellisii TaxID=2023197 RepID=A0A2N0B6A1_9LEPT|nr:family 2A encapsulin nanocompartment cargo protein cysteine desulfurase [Leptospira ellisii]MDV6234833.1 family 2A encapsulin nanocompartment cargo protein cysteine desulfurase [Leptospira ellisii]PJZ92079.1 cysteine desulfurase [Leptospira ellisii]